MEFSIVGTISFDVDFDIEASSEEEAIKIAKEQLMDYYRLNVSNAEHDMESVEINIDAIEYEDEDEDE